MQLRRQRAEGPKIATMKQRGDLRAVCLVRAIARDLYGVVKGSGDVLELLLMIIVDVD